MIGNLCTLSPPVIVNIMIIEPVLNIEQNSIACKFSLILLGSYVIKFLLPPPSPLLSLSIKVFTGLERAWSSQVGYISTIKVETFSIILFLQLCPIVFSGAFFQIKLEVVEASLPFLIQVEIYTIFEQISALAPGQSPIVTFLRHPMFQEVLQILTFKIGLTMTLFSFVNQGPGQRCILDQQKCWGPLRWWHFSISRFEL